MIKEVMIEGVKYTIRCASILLLDNEECVGLCSSSESVINISKKCGEGAEAVTLMHEIVHAILISRGFDKENKNEKFVEGLAVSLINLIRLNPHLIKFIRDEGKLDYNDYSTFTKVSQEKTIEVVEDVVEKHNK